MIPDFDENGNLPPGIHRCTAEEVKARFGHGSSERVVETGELIQCRESAWNSGDRIMTPRLTDKGYALTKEKLAWMEARLAAVRERSDLPESHKAMVIHSYLDMIRQFLKEIKLFEAMHADAAAGDNP